MSCGCNQNPAVCGSNPCATSALNTAACETLPSQISNFTTQFFGEVTKTEVDGVVTWVLPCSLDVGLPANPRLEGEGLACYFLRLFNDGIVGLTGPQGIPGEAGTDGYNAFSVTMASFTQPTLALPNIQIAVQPNPTLLADTYVYIQGSGWYLITATDGAGTLWLTLQKALSGVTGSISAGRLIFQSGFPGASVTGPQGPQGAQGPAGTPGASYTATNGLTFYSGGAETDYVLDVTMANVNFGVGLMSVLLPAAGTYLLTAQVQVVGLAAVIGTDVATFQFRNSSDSTDVLGSEVETSRFAVGEIRTVTMTILATVAGPKDIRLRGKATTVNHLQVNADNTTFSFVRLA